MSGHLRICTPNTPIHHHDHLDLCLVNNTMLRYYDPRRFGLCLYSVTPAHPLLAHLGVEPLTEAFHPSYLLKVLAGKKMPIKTAIMTNRLVVGIGNIYAAESLFVAGIHPLVPAGEITYSQATQLCHAIKYILLKAIKAGGTTLRDYYTASGNRGYFQQELAVYGRSGLACHHCQYTLKSLTISGRSTVFCPNCQPF